MAKFLSNNKFHVALNVLWALASIIVATVKPDVATAASASTLLAVVNAILHAVEGK